MKFEFHCSIDYVVEDRNGITFKKIEGYEQARGSFGQKTEMSTQILFLVPKMVQENEM